MIDGERPASDGEFKIPQIIESSGNLSAADSILSGEIAIPTESSFLEPEDEVSPSEFTIPQSVQSDVGKRAVIEVYSEEICPLNEADMSHDQIREKLKHQIVKIHEQWWNMYGKLITLQGLDLRLTGSYQDFRRYHADIDGRIDSLAQAKYDLLQFGKTPEGKTPKGTNIGETFQPILIPWEFFAKHCDEPGKIASAIRSMQQHQGIKEHFLDKPELEKFSKVNGSYPYIEGGYEHGSTINRRAKELLVKEGWWGIRLMQTSDDYGSAQLSPDGSNNVNYQDIVQMGVIEGLGNQSINLYTQGMGIYEWLALTLQVKPVNISGKNIFARHIEDDKRAGRIKFMTAEWDEEWQRVKYEYNDKSRSRGNPDYYDYRMVV